MPIEHHLKLSINFYHLFLLIDLIHYLSLLYFICSVYNLLASINPSQPQKYLLSDIPMLLCSPIHCLPHPLTLSFLAFNLSLRKLNNFFPILFLPSFSIILLGLVVMGWGLAIGMGVEILVMYMGVIAAGVDELRYVCHKYLKFLEVVGWAQGLDEVELDGFLFTW
jgi:hypothetical protein